MNRRANRLAARRGGILPRPAARGVRARGTKGLVPHAAMRSPASAQAALTYTVKLIQEGPTLFEAMNQLFVILCTASTIVAIVLYRKIGLWWSFAIVFTLPILLFVFAVAMLIIGGDK